MIFNEPLGDYENHYPVSLLLRIIKRARVRIGQPLWVKRAFLYSMRILL